MCQNCPITTTRHCHTTCNLARHSPRTVGDIVGRHRVEVHLADAPHPVSLQPLDQSKRVLLPVRGLHAHAELDRLVRRLRYVDRKQVGQLRGVPGHERDVPRRPRSVSARTTREDVLAERLPRPGEVLSADLEHSNLRFESIRFDSLCESIRIDSFC